MNKAELRLAYKAKRVALSAEQRENYSLELANSALGLPLWEGQYYHLFLPIERLNEINTEYLLHLLQGKDKSVVLPKVAFKTHSLKHYLLEDHTPLKTSKYGVPEPESGLEVPANAIDVVFVPLLAFDLAGNRLGYGKGFYDGFLSQCKPSVIKVGLSFFPAEQQIPVTTQDVPLDYCITPNKVYKFN